MTMMQLTYDDSKLTSLYEKVVVEPNKNNTEKGFITCPSCGEKILMIPTLRVMNTAIENHVLKHKEELKADPIKSHQTAISIRFALMEQVLQQACNLQVP